ncbi:MAG: LytR C-terminal domain-containing protein [Acidimicrobiia bacterium]|nr:LytR C-terminal domain-containing protein [Acidimicrobiia bacterium]
MNPSASRGAILVVIGLVVGALVLGQAFDDSVPNATVTVDTGGTAETGDTDTDSGTDESADDGGGESTDGGDVVDDGTGGTETDPDGTETTPPLTPGERDPAEVKVLVANGAQVNGAAGQAAGSLAAANYTTLSPTNAEVQEVTLVYYEATYEADAAAVARILNAPPGSVVALPATNPAGVDPRGANIVVILGQDEVPQPG